MKKTNLLVLVRESLSRLLQSVGVFLLHLVRRRGYLRLQPLFQLRHFLVSLGLKVISFVRLSLVNLEQGVWRWWWQNSYNAGDRDPNQYPHQKKIINVSII